MSKLKLSKQSIKTTIKFCGWNFVLFFIIAVCLGGDALSGGVIDGKYYLSNHGQLTEVSKWIFIYSKIHTLSLLVTHPLAIFLGIKYFSGKC